MTDCEHKFTYGGVKYEVSQHPMAGTGAGSISYYDWYFCEKCLEKKYDLLDASSNTYENILFNATPKV